MTTYRPRRPVAAAYKQAKMTRQCPNCQAAPNNYCIHPDDGLVRTIPCLRRMIPKIPQDPAEAAAVHDFSEPRRRFEEA